MRPQFRGQFHPAFDALVRVRVVPFSESTEREDAQWLEEVPDPAHDCSAVVCIDWIGVCHVDVVGPQNIPNRIEQACPNKEFDRAALQGVGRWASPQRPEPEPAVALWMQADAIALQDRNRSSRSFQEG